MAAYRAAYPKMMGASATHLDGDSTPRWAPGAERPAPAQAGSSCCRKRSLVSRSM
jgi:hypothetical protein